MPALIALLWQMWRARDLIRSREAARGFAMPVQAEPEEIVGVAEIVPEAMLYNESDREK